MAIKTKTIKQEVYFEAKPEEAYDALVDERKHSEITGAAATGTAKEGGRFTAWDGYISGRNIKLTKGKKIIQEWKTTEWPEGAGPSKVTFTFKPKKGGTLLTMVHSKVPLEQAGDYEQGWKDNYWDLMEKYFEKKKQRG
jgi:activator of HSP90 ATPase